MGAWGQDEGQADIVRISEKIYLYKGDKKKLELELSEENLRYQYIPKRKSLVIHQVFLLAILMVACIVLILLTLGDVFSMFLDWFLFLFFLYLSWKQAKLLFLLFASRNTESAARFAEKHDLDTFQRQKQSSEKKIAFLGVQIEELDKKIADLLLKKEELLQEREQREKFLRDKGILYDEKPGKKTSGFSLRQNSTGSQDMHALHEYYEREEIYLNQTLLRMDGELRQMDKQIVEIDECFMHVKKQMLFSLAVFVVMVLLQRLLSGLPGTLYGIICFIVCLCYAFYLERTCKRPILEYLLEHDSPLVTDYAFCNNLVPVKTKRKEKLEQIEQYKKELDEIKKQKEEMVFD